MLISGMNLEQLHDFVNRMGTLGFELALFQKVVLHLDLIMELRMKLV